ncbi:hypothetical protein GCM10010331_74400 [Streptomyces xanthochromogenes]|uniref:hypothetical protein n=1 Tax=Streptomyces xanthochromogenes TaxID=67384 RepID=UPI0016757741|nr:hypothetical protein [Streptomyces xanthochromogenes]GHB75708.1 hypothetical protein GCM10010331_74400 [Streptomyces xanthochromogenes]
MTPPRNRPGSASQQQHRSGEPKWTTLERKEARLRSDQLADLADLRRHLSARRLDRSEIITDNTLIRVAVDVLLQVHAERLQGDTEEALLASALPRRRASVAAEESAQGEAGETVGKGRVRRSVGRGERQQPS